MDDPEVAEDRQALDIIKEHLAKYEQKGVNQGWMSVAQLRVRETKDKKGLLNFQVSHLLFPANRHALEVALSHILLKMGCEYRPGGPPRSDAERKIQAKIDDLKMQLAKR